MLYNSDHDKWTSLGIGMLAGNQLFELANFLLILSHFRGIKRIFDKSNEYWQNDISYTYYYRILNFDP